MAKFHDVVGYATTVETAPGVWEDTIIEKTYSGELVRNNTRFQDVQAIHDDLTLGHSISVVADAYANEHIFAIRYVKWQGTLWKVLHVDVQRPRLLLRLGGPYNGPTP